MKLGWKRNLAASVLLVAIIVTGALFFTNNSSVSQVTQSGPLTVSFKFFDNDIASKIAYITFAFPSSVSSEGLNYGELPKGLIEFHLYPSGTRTPFEEHLLESLACLRNQDFRL